MEVTSEVERKEIGGILETMGRKIQLELTNTSRVGNINDTAYLPASTKAKPDAATTVQPAAETKPVPTVVTAAAIEKKYDWYQNHQFIFISFKVSSPDVSQSTEVTFTDSSVTLKHPSLENGEWTLPLTN